MEESRHAPKSETAPSGSGKEPGPSFSGRSVLSALAGLAVVLASATVFALRYPAAFTLPNLYGEDAFVFLDNIFEHGVIGAAFIAFNGYLVVGLYLVADVAIAVLAITGLPFTALPVIVATLSCLALGLIASLPFLLLRKQLGVVVALVAVALISFVPMPLSDADVIGTIGNLKFAFVFVAMILLIYRATRTASLPRVVLVDIALVLCVLTNVIAVALLPALFVLRIRELVGDARRRRLAALFTAERISALTVVAISFAYVVVVLLKGVPVYPGYLDAPYDPAATFEIISHSTTYAFLYPVASTTTAVTVAIVLLSVLLWGVGTRPARPIVAFGMYTIAITSIGFVYNRPGIAAFMFYGDSPDQFFYTQCMIFILVCVCIVGANLRSSRSLVAFATVALLSLVMSVPSGSSFGANSERFAPRTGTFENNVRAACAIEDGSETIAVPIYPLAQYVWTVSRDRACPQ